MKLEIISWPKNYCTYKEGAEFYSMTEHYVKKFAKDANAIIRLGSKRLNLIDRRVFEAYLMENNPSIRGYHKRMQELGKETDSYETRTCYEETEALH